MKQFFAPVLFGVILIALLFSSQLRSGLRCALGSEQYEQQQFLAMGTLVGVAARHCDANKLQAGMAAAESAVREIEADWHAWQDSRLFAINQALASSGQADIPADLQPRFERARELAAASGGLFDPTIGRLVELWGFHDEEAFRSTPPTAVEIETLLTGLYPLHELQYQDGTLQAPTGVWLDFGAIAKGHGVDRALAALAAAGIEHGMVDGGGDLRVIGHSIGSDGERPWTIGLRNPRAGGILARVQLQSGEALFTSGDYERYFEHAGRRYHHVVNPKTGYPTTGVASVSVLAKDGELADAAATALMVAPLADWPRLAQALGISQVLRVAHNGEIAISDGLAERVTWVGDAARQSVVRINLEL